MIIKYKVPLNIEISVHGDKTNPAPNPLYLFLKNEYNGLVKKYQEDQDEDFVGGMPVQLEKDCLKQLLIKKSNYYATLKVDGERFLLFLSSNGTLYFIDRSVNFYYFVKEDEEPLNPIDTSKLKPFLFDGELVYHKTVKIYEFLIFDTLFYDNVSYIEKDYYTRYDVADHALKNVLNGYFKMLDENIFSSLKTWYSINSLTTKTKNIYRYISKETNDKRKLKLVSDGIILQPFDTPYVPFGPWNRYNNVQFKWKPSDQLTIDFKIKAVGPHEWRLLTKTDQEYGVKQPDGTVEPAICIPTDVQKGKYFDGDVVEFKLKETANKKGNLFIPLKVRNEKEANGYNTIMSTLRVIHNPFTLDILSYKELSKEHLQLFSESDLILCCLSSFFNKYETKQIKKVYDRFVELKKEKNVEMEFRLFKNGKNGKTLDKFTWYYLFDYLKSNFNYTYNESVDISENKKGSKFRTSYPSLKELDKPIVNEVKDKIINYTMEPKRKLYNNLTFKLELSSEIKTNRQIGLKSFFAGKYVNNNIRVKNRTTFEINKYWKLDLTKVLSAYTLQTLADKNESYELECEYINQEEIDFEEFVKSFSDIYILLLSNSGFCGDI